MTQTQFDSIQKLVETLAANINAGMLLFALFIALSGLIFVYTGFLRQKGENKKSDGYDLVLQRMAEIERESRERSQRDIAELARQRATNEKQRQIIDEQQKNAAVHAAAAQEALKALQDHNRLIVEGNKVAEERNSKLTEDITNVKINLADGISVAQENNEILKKEVKPLVETQSKILETIATVVTELPATTAAAIIQHFEPLKEELHAVALGVHELAVSIKDQIDLEKIEELARRIDGLQQQFDNIKQMLNKPPTESPTLPSRPVE